MADRPLRRPASAGLAAATQTANNPAAVLEAKSACVVEQAACGLNEHRRRTRKKGRER
jgi:hypothetical protein